MQILFSADICTGGWGRGAEEPAMSKGRVRLGLWLLAQTVWVRQGFYMVSRSDLIIRRFRIHNPINDNKDGIDINTLRFKKSQKYRFNVANRPTATRTNKGMQGYQSGWWRASWRIWCANLEIWKSSEEDWSLQIQYLTFLAVLHIIAKISFAYCGFWKKMIRNKFW